MYCVRMMSIKKTKKIETNNFRVQDEPTKNDLQLYKKIRVDNAKLEDSPQPTVSCDR